MAQSSWRGVALRSNKPELLAPAGDAECMAAAVEFGADAVYFGLQGHNARARATNFAFDELEDVFTRLHRRSVRGYVALNTLAFPSELEEIETIVRRLAQAGCDAVIVQDLGVVRLIREICPDLEIHASTQTSITNQQGLTLARDLGCTRVILARELSLEDIERLQKDPVLPLEVFVHGALCVAYSGQCLTSEALGQRSANRGECAQACRLPYDLVSDGLVREFGDLKYLLSPKDLAAYDLIPRLVELGVASFKIEGRLKTPEYVANITRYYRQAIDSALEGKPKQWNQTEIHEMELSFSRGFSHGFLDGNNHKKLVRGDYSKKKGLFVGEIARISRNHVYIHALAHIKPGDGVVFDGNESAGTPEQGGRVYEVVPQEARSVESTPRNEGKPELLALGFGKRDLDLTLLTLGQKLWKNDDPELNARLRAGFSGAPRRLVGLELEIVAETGKPLEIKAETADGRKAAVLADSPLEPAQRLGADEASLKTQVDRFGGTVYQVASLGVDIVGNPFVPASLVNQLRRELVAILDEQARASSLPVALEPVLPMLMKPITQAREDGRAADDASVRLSVLCRTIDQALAAAQKAAETIYLEFQDVVLYGPAIEELRRFPVKVYLATLRIEKPGEEGLIRRLARLGADGFLVRNASGLDFCSHNKTPFVADFSLNASNALTVELLRSKGAQRVTASYDLSSIQLEELLESVPPEWIEIVIHQHIPMFHMEHCVFCAVLSPGTDKTNCGRPCDFHTVELRDRVGVSHPLKADVGCRNTLFSGVPQTAAEVIPRLLALGSRDLRIEFLDETPNDVSRTIDLYKQAIDGKRNPAMLWKALKASNQYGITRGSFEEPAGDLVQIQSVPVR